MQMNSVNIPFPIIYLAYGAEGLAAATLFYIPNIITIYTFGVYIMAGGHWRDNVKEVVKLPVVYAAILGLIFNFTNVSMPELAMNTLDFISLMAIPLVLIILGHNLSRAKMSSLPTTFLASFLRMGVGLGIGLLCVSILDIGGVYRSVVILDSVMPAAAVSALLSTKYKNEAGLVPSVVLITTVASLVIIPLILHMLA
jgi:predicted permease